MTLLNFKINRMKNKNPLWTILCLTVLSFFVPQQLSSQIIDSTTIWQNLSELSIEKNKVDDANAMPAESMSIAGDTASSKNINLNVIDDPNFLEYRLKPEQIKLIFPEVVYKINNKYVIDYYSLFPIIIELLVDQQKQINNLQIKLNKLNN